MNPSIFRSKSLAMFGAAVFWLASGFAQLAPVGLAEDDFSYTLTNQWVTARVSKRSGDLTSLKYRGLELLDRESGHAAGYWSHDVSHSDPVQQITIDPRRNGGARAEVSLKGVSDGNQMGSGPGGSVIADIEIRYALGRADSGIYTYCVFSHPTNYPGTSVGEARFCAKLNDNVFDWMTVDANRNMRMLTAYDWNHGTVMNMKEARRMNSGIYQGQVEHKYDYSANQFDVRAWGWSSTEKHVGLWFVNPSVEYLSGGPTKYELSAHRDATFNTNALNAPAVPTLLNYWRSSHYGGSMCSIAATDNWTKVIGPFLIYVNSGMTPDVMWQDALAKSAAEEKAWPYDWVAGVDYPRREQRATVRGQMVLNDPGAPRLKMSNLLVGVSAPDYTPARINRGGFQGFGLAGGGDDDTNTPPAIVGGGFGRNTNAFNFTNRFARFGTNFNSSTNQFGGRRRFGRGGPGGGFGGFGPRIVEWQNDAKNYQFWVRADEQGRFTIPNVRPGTYTLHAFADGVLGEYALTNVVVAAGQSLSLGKLQWQPPRFGKTLWEIGIPNRKASEFFKGDSYYHWGWYLEYPKLFPNDVNFTIGKSDFRRDWFFEQVPHNENLANNTGAGWGRATTWSVNFNLDQTPKGKATLRLGICGVGARGLTVLVNDKPAGSINDLMPNSAIHRDGITGMYAIRNVGFDAALLKAGENRLQLSIPAGSLTSGIQYDYLRLELDETSERTNAGPDEGRPSGSPPPPAGALLSPRAGNWR